MALSLNKKLIKDQLKSFGSFDEENCAALEALKEFLKNQPDLALLRNEVKYTMETDVGDKQIDCVSARATRHQYPAGGILVPHTCR